MVQQVLRLHVLQVQATFIIQKAVDVLKSFGAPYEVHIYSAHRTPVEARDFALSARDNGFGVLIAAAGMAAHLAGALAANTTTSYTYASGTNSIGQDLWSQIWQGTRTSLIIGVCAATTSMLLGMLMGCAWGYARKFDWLFTEIYNLFDNIPYTILRMLLILILRPSIGTMILVMCLTGWLGMAKYIRNQIVIYRDREFNLASRCLGTSGVKIITKNILPQLVSVIMLRMALAIPGAIGSEAFLAYIGLGLPLDTPSLGNLANNGRKLMSTPTLRYQLLIPSAFLAIITICFYLIGNAFADAADPRNHV